MPLAVVFFQNSSMMMAGRLAEAATANAKPTRKVTFTPWKRMPSTMASPPMTNAEIFPALHFLTVIHLDSHKAVEQVVRDGA